MQEYTLKQISKHKTKGDLWLVVDNKIYDVSNFLEKHPGGVKPFMKNAGKDVSKYFHGITKIVC